VLTETAIAGRVDYLLGLKENVIGRRLISPRKRSTSPTSTTSSKRARNGHARLP
jgi:hypothetical protein